MTLLLQLCVFAVATGAVMATVMTMGSLVFNRT
jgi:hypothetical protein